ncbi:hypothetical protein Goari_027276 [Gossypium aridum]|uniref:CCHC-type domain-containing protein n=1 Tax=Gossypium aridum TaxID=34290 RepID=A0A7J8YPQ9_GOSAI|nr:hypothetical protein [Gossypium aridum]
MSFEEENDLEMIMEGRPWLFRRQLIIFDRLKEFSWMSKNHYGGEFLLQLAINRKFGSPLGMHNLPNFCFGCGRMGHVAKDCTKISNLGVEKLEDDLPYRH